MRGAALTVDDLTSKRHEHGIDTRSGNDVRARGVLEHDEGERRFATGLVRRQNRRNLSDLTARAIPDRPHGQLGVTDILKRGPTTARGRFESLSTSSPLRPRGLAAGLVGALILAALLRGIFPTADPPWKTTVGVVWHDEGAWTHNARNRALFGVWQTDNWNPLYIAPVFTALEYASFATFGVGTWQARLVSEAAGCAAVLLLGLGVARIGGAAAGVMAALLLATNYVGDHV